MVALATLDETKEYLRVDHDDTDTILQTLIEMASERIIEYLKDYAATFFDPDASPQIIGTVPARVKVSVMQLTGHFYRNPDSVGDFTLGRMPFDVTNPIYPLRLPTIADPAGADEGGSPSGSP